MAAAGRGAQNDEKKDSGASSDNEADADAADAERERDEATNLIVLLYNNFLSPYTIFVDTYLQTFIRPSERALHKLSKQKQDSLETIHKALLDLTLELFTEYFALARKELLKRANIAPEHNVTQHTSHVPSLIRAALHAVGAVF